VTSAILYVHSDPYIISALNSGVLDCVIKICDPSFYEKILRQGGDVKQANILINIEPIDLKLYPDVLTKKSLIRMRFPAFQLLRENLQLAEAKNILGFNNNTAQIILSALNDENRIIEYAKVMGISSDFAKSELTMLSDSLTIDSFRIFTLSRFWTKKINNCETIEEAKELMEPIKRSFWSAGIPRV
jgi:hypothetical protein